MASATATRRFQAWVSCLLSAIRLLLLQATATPPVCMVSATATLRFQAWVSCLLSAISLLLLQATAAPPVCMALSMSWINCDAFTTSLQAANSVYTYTDTASLKVFTRDKSSENSTKTRKDSEPIYEKDCNVFPYEDQGEMLKVILPDLNNILVPRPEVVQACSNEPVRYTDDILVYY